jgi:hypothetical protein
MYIEQVQPLTVDKGDDFFLVWKKVQQNINKNNFKLQRLTLDD